MNLSTAPEKYHRTTLWNAELDRSIIRYRGLLFSRIVCYEKRHGNARYVGVWRQLSTCPIERDLERECAPPRKCLSFLSRNGVFSYILAQYCLQRKNLNPFCTDIVQGQPTVCIMGTGRILPLTMLTNDIVRAAQLSQRNRATHHVGWILVICCTKSL